MERFTAVYFMRQRGLIYPLRRQMSHGLHNSSTNLSIGTFSEICDVRRIANYPG